MDELSAVGLSWSAIGRLWRRVCLWCLSALGCASKVGGTEGRLGRWDGG